MSAMQHNVIFVSYRRDDATPYALALMREFERHLRSVEVFVDTQRIFAASEWPAAIAEKLKQAFPMIVLIGPNWLAPEAGTGQPRLFNPDDWVFKEIKYTLENRKDAIIPVLVGGARLPHQKQLPPDLLNS